MKKKTTILQVKNIQKEFNTPVGVIEVLKSISFNLDKAENIALVGASGSGKSTLLSLLAGLDIPTNGNIFFQGINLSHANEKELQEVRSFLSIVFQQIYLIDHLNILENIMLPLEIKKKNKKEILQKALDLLEKIGLLHRKNSYPYQVSGGEAQRAAIARALISNPRIILADEPTGNLDSKNGKKIAELLFRIVKEESSSLILVTHNEKLANQCDRKLILENGYIVEK